MIDSIFDSSFWIFDETHAFFAVKWIYRLLYASSKFSCSSCTDGFFKAGGAKTNVHLNRHLNKKCAAEAAHEKCSLILLRHSSLLQIGNEDKAYIFTQKVCLSVRILNCVAKLLYQDNKRIARINKHRAIVRIQVFIYI